MSNLERTHLDLFSGIGGFALAARANGVRTVQFIEIDQHCRGFLAKAWPGVPIHEDIRTFALADSGFQRRQQISGSSPADEGQDARRPEEGNNQPQGNGESTSISMANPCQVKHGRWPALPQQGTERGIAPRWPGQQVWLLTGGVPCQPASRAGKQRGKEDDRWLWPEAVRVIAAVHPTWALLENPPGIGDVGFLGILSQVEAQGYEVRVLSIPACAVGAPHRRERFWIVAHAKEGREQSGFHGRAVKLERSEPRRDPEQCVASNGVGLADSSQPGCERPESEPGKDGLRAEHSEGDLAHATQRGQREHGGAQGQCGYADERDEGGMGNSQSEREQRWPMQTGRHERPFSGSDRPIAPEPWSNFVWLPCADGKVRRAPDDSFGLVDGLHRSLLGALGNSIIPQVAERIIAAMIQSEEQP